MKQNRRAEELVDTLRGRFPGIRIDVTGHSLGGALALQVSANHDSSRAWVFNASYHFRNRELKENDRWSIAEGWDALSFVRIALRNPDIDHFPYFNCQSGGNPFSRHDIDWLAWCVTTAASLDSTETRAKASLAANPKMKQVIEGGRARYENAPPTPRSTAKFTSESCAGAPCSDSVTIRSLGVAGFVIKHGRHTLITGPSITNPPKRHVFTAAFPFLRWMVSRLEPNEPLIRRVIGADTANVEAILIGQGHYDHALDSRIVASKLAVNALLLGSQSTINMLRGDSLVRRRPGETRAIDSKHAADSWNRGEWYYTPGGGFRILAIETDHAPNAQFLRIFKVRYAKGKVRDTSLSRPPRTAADWKIGEQTYAFLIDVLAEGSRDKVLRRIYFQDSAPSPFIAVPTEKILAESPVDVAILTVANAHLVDQPYWLLRQLQPPIVIGAHWESFFRTQEQPVTRSISAKDKRFEGAVMGALAPGSVRFVMPKPQEVVSVGIP
jgi:hypothetical protein